MISRVSIILLLLGGVWTNSLLAHPGVGIVMDSKGNVFYTDLVHVWKIATDGTQTIAVRDVHTHELYLDAEDNLYGEHVWYEGEATDKWGHYIWSLRKNGELIRTKEATEGFPEDNTLRRDYDGNTYWSTKVDEHDVLKITEAGGKKRLLSTHQFDDIRWMFVAPCSKDIFVIDHLSLKKVNTEGEVEMLAENLKEGGSIFSRVNDHHYLYGVWFDGDDNVYVAVYGASKVIKIMPGGKKETVHKSSRGWSPSGGLIGNDGTSWIMEFSSRNKTRVVKISAEGERQVFQGK
jgi:hypothetical protein